MAEASKTLTMQGSTADGTYMVSGRSGQYGECELAYIVFYDANGVSVTPTAGTLTVQYSPNYDGQNADTDAVWRDISNGTLDLTTVNDADASMPYGQGLVRGIRVAFANGANVGVTFKAEFWRS